MRSLNYSEAANDVLPLFKRSQFRLLKGGVAREIAASHGDSVPNKPSERDMEREQAHKMLPSQRRHVPPPIGSDAAAFLAQLNEVYGGHGIQIDTEDEELPHAMRKHMRQVIDQD